MIARATTPLPVPRASCETASRMPGATVLMFRFTPMTPVEATSTCSTGQASAVARLAGHGHGVGVALGPGAGVGAPAVDDDSASVSG